MRTRSLVLPAQPSTEEDALVLLDVGRYLLDSGQTEAARRWLERAEGLYRTTGPPAGVHDALWSKGDSYIAERRSHEALRVLPEPGPGSPNLGFHCHVAWFDALVGAGDRASAADHLHACERLMAEHGGLSVYRDLLNGAWAQLAGGD